MSFKVGEIFGFLLSSFLFGGCFIGLYFLGHINLIPSILLSIPVPILLFLIIHWYMKKLFYGRRKIHFYIPAILYFVIFIVSFIILFCMIHYGYFFELKNETFQNSTSDQIKNMSTHNPDLIFNDYVNVESNILRYSFIFNIFISFILLIDVALIKIRYIDTISVDKALYLKIGDLLIYAIIFTMLSYIITISLNIEILPDQWTSIAIYYVIIGYILFILIPYFLIGNNIKFKK